MVPVGFLIADVDGLALSDVGEVFVDGVYCEGGDGSV